MRRDYTSTKSVGRRSFEKLRILPPPAPLERASKRATLPSKQRGYWTAGVATRFFGCHAHFTWYERERLWTTQTTPPPCLDVDEYVRKQRDLRGSERLGYVWAMGVRGLKDVLSMTDSREGENGRVDEMEGVGGYGIRDIPHKWWVWEINSKGQFTEGQKGSRDKIGERGGSFDDGPL